MDGGGVSLVITHFDLQPTPVESHDLLGSLAKEERKRAGLGGCYSLTFLFHAPPFLVPHSRSHSAARAWGQNAR